MVLVLEKELNALCRRSLHRTATNAVLPIVHHPLLDQLHAGGPHRREVVIRQREVQQAPYPAHRLRHMPIKVVPRQIQLLHPPHAAHRLWYRPRQPVVPRVEHRRYPQQPHLVREAPRQLIVQQQHLHQRFCCAPNTAWDPANEPVVCQRDVVYR